jgi:endonuclease/exonuclease/phosphatase (EEP) superfamily protein YafD
MNHSFSLLTLNCFGGYMPYTSRRLLALAQELEQRSDQVVCLQEIQLHRYRHLLVKACTGFSHPFYEPYLHCPKGGLLTLSRFPMSTHFEPYIERGLWYTPMFMDKLLYKGMLIHKRSWNEIPMVIINTHVLANYVGDWDRRGLYSRVEEQQLGQLAKTVRSQPEDSIIIVVGDFNIPRGSRLYQDFLENSGLTDPLAGDRRPTLRVPPGVPSRFALPIDYVLVRMPERQMFKVDCDLCFTGKYKIHRWHQDYLSDHKGIELRITTN